MLLCVHEAQDDPGGAFLVNVAVEQRFRRQGVGRKLISAAVKTATQRLMAKRLYTHIDCDNEAAWRLYQQQGFDIYDDAACNLPGDTCRRIAFMRLLVCISDAVHC